MDNLFGVVHVICLLHQLFSLILFAASAQLSWLQRRGTLVCPWSELIPLFVAQLLLPSVKIKLSLF